MEKPVLRTLRWGLVWAVTFNTLFAAPAAASAPKPVALTEKGKTLEMRYSQELKKLRAEIANAVPKVEPEKKAAYLQARKEQEDALSDLKAAQKALAEIEKARGLVKHAKTRWIPKAESGIASTEAKLKQAKTEEERAPLQAQLAKYRENLAAGQKALKERAAALAAIEKDEARRKGAVDSTAKALDEARARAKAALDACNLKPFLKEDGLDVLLAKCAVLTGATPRGLAAFAQQGEAQAALVEALLADKTLMQQMVVAGGARAGRYAEAMKIYTEIQKVSEHACKPGILQRLALGTSLEMVMQYQQRYGTYLKGGIKPVDPVKRYLHYEKAFLAGELDPDFKTMTAWECRWIVCDPASNEELAWLRTMMRNYRPDLPRDPDPRWYYSRIIKTDVRYNRPKWDPSLPVTRLQEAIDKGGICHIRAWIARSTARAFGIPALRVEEGAGK